MVRRGQLTAAQAAVHPHRSVITRALGTEAAVQPDIFEMRWSRETGCCCAATA